MRDSAFRENEKGETEKESFLGWQMYVRSLDDSPLAVGGHQPLDGARLDNVKGGLKQIRAKQVRQLEEGHMVKASSLVIHIGGLGEGQVDDFSIEGIGRHGEN